MPEVVARAEDGTIAGFENRCAHRGALICLDNKGHGATDFQCVVALRSAGQPEADCLSARRNR
jgi:phenylpropionate dioxygenase-like ring-hydroxylating dioxygenase large terminal subunit